MKKTAEVLMAEGVRLKTKKDSKWVHKKSGAVYQVSDNVVDCKSNDWVVVYTMVTKKRFPEDPWEDLYDQSNPPVKFCRNYNEFLEKFEVLQTLQVSLTKDELEAVKQNIRNNTNA